MSKGTVKFFNAGKGFGFITPDDGGSDIFLPAAAMSASAISRLKPGQRVSFEQAPDTKGPKVVKLQLLEEAPRPAPPSAAAAKVTVYYDPAADDEVEILETVRAMGYQPQPVDYRTAPPSREELRRLSMLLSGTGQSLVRRYDPLFLELQLDDRFMGEGDFWTAIVEHPALINGPVVVSAGRARVCRAPEEVRAFLSGDEGDARQPKALSPRMLAMLKGQPMPAEEPPAMPASAAAEAPKRDTPEPRPTARKTRTVKPAAAKPAKPAAKKAPAKTKAVKPAKKSAAKTKKK